MIKGLLIASLSLLTVFGTQAGALTFSYEKLNGTFGGNGVAYDSVSTSYNNLNSQFTWQVDLASAPMSDFGFWLVVGPGPNPKGHANEYAIWFADYNNVSGGDAVLAAYRYNGVNGFNSLTTPGDFLGDFSAGLTSNGSDVFGFDINVAGINALAYGPDWLGTQYGEQIGIWFHPAFGVNTQYDSDEGFDCSEGIRGCYSYLNQGWLDNAYETTKVAEPSSLAILGLGLIGLAYVSRNRK